MPLCEAKLLDSICKVSEGGFGGEPARPEKSEKGRIEKRGKRAGGHRQGGKRDDDNSTSFPQGSTPSTLGSQGKRCSYLRRTCKGEEYISCKGDLIWGWGGGLGFLGGGVGVGVGGGGGVEAT